MYGLPDSCLEWPHIIYLTFNDDMDEASLWFLFLQYLNLSTNFNRPTYIRGQKIEYDVLMSWNKFLLLVFPSEFLFPPYFYFFERHDGLNLGNSY